ncbi:3Beta-HSD domain-containing protein [Fusarium sp. LHS14.1]|nr:3Beta-HSD domain-containing protein [Fusarium sp. LHS14.1]
MTPQKASSAPLLGTTLVVGGCGFLGYHLVRHLLADNESGAVHVVDRDISKNQLGNVTYTRGSITDSKLLRSLIAKIKPSVVFHIASPIASLPASREGEFFETNVKGTEVLLTVAAESESVQAFVYTSSVDIHTDPPYLDVTESHELWSASDKSNEYNRTKAIADRLVREANGPQLRTVTLRLGHAYGERHIQGMVEVLDMCEGSKNLVQVGSGENVMEVVSADNSSIAHVLAAKALLDPSRATGKVDGEGFNISDGVPKPFWHHIKLIWKTALGQDELNNLTILPAWIMIVAVNVVEWVLWIFTLNMIKPPVELRRVSLEYCLDTHTYSIEKARERLGFKPVSDHDAVLVESVQWMLRHREALKKTE